MSLAANVRIFYSKSQLCYNTMKIALIRKEYTLTWGGAESYVVNLSRLLAGRGHEVHVFANSWDLPAEPRITFHKVPVLSWYSPLKNLSFALNVRRLLKGAQFDIVHGFSQAFPQDVYRAGDGLHSFNLEMRSSSGLTRTLSRLNPRHFIILTIEKQIFKPDHYGYIIANSKLCKQQLMSCYHVPEDRIEVIYNGVDLNRFNPGVKQRYRKQVREKIAVDTDARVMLYVSRNYKRKGLEQLIRSVSLLKKNRHRIKLVVVGRETSRPYQRLAAELGVADRVIFIDETPAVEEYYGASDFLILPTLYDPFSNVCLEALACGLPVITTRNNGAAELINEGVNGGVLEDANRLEAMAEKISRMIPEGVCETMGEHAAVTARHYTLEKNLEKTLEIYNKVISDRKRFAFSRHNGIIVNREAAELLAKNNLFDFDAVMRCNRGATVKQVGVLRSTVRMALKDNDGEAGVYLKRYRRGGIKCLAGISPRGTAMNEWDNILAFHRLGIPTMIPLAAGMRKTGPAQCESFLITRELEGTERLDHYLARDMIRPLTGKQIADKRQLIKELALLIRRMHGSGINHRDLYLCHLLVKKIAPASPRIYIADLHRAQRRNRVPARWKVKDLAALNYSADLQFVTRTDRLRFLRHYGDGGGTHPSCKPFIRKVLRKTERIRLHDGKLRQKKSNHAHTGNALCEKIF